MRPQTTQRREVLVFESNNSVQVIVSEVTKKIRETGMPRTPFKLRF
jgi:hypothetical protein